ncbi:fimbrial protein [Siccibacter turicensis]|uniref:fimbrial protein n=1 Tax=Siccibacter turicensis TaxID=357233 RepID=UPI001020817F|nr:fimbrial protein [Siccibacter turicensis]
MTNTKYYASLLLMGSALYAGMVKAADITMNFTATVVASPCTVDSDSVTKAIQLDGGNGVQATDLQDAGASTPWVYFDLGVKDCPAGTTRITITFSGTADPASPDNLYMNTGTAKNASVELQSHDGLYMFGDGKSYTGTVRSDKTFYFSERARVYTNAGGVTPGTIQALVTANFTYQ